MAPSIRGLRALVLMLACAGLTLPAMPTAVAGADFPSLRLFAARSELTVTRGRGERVFLDPGVHVTPVGGSLVLRAERRPYTDPITVVQETTVEGETLSRELPDDAPDGWRGLGRFFFVHVTDDAGNLVHGFGATFCPNSYEPARLDDDSVPVPSFPPDCFANPFTRGMVWGIDDGWAANPFAWEGVRFSAPDGHYRVTVSISRRYRQFFGVPSSDAVATVGVTIRTGRSDCCDQSPGAPSRSGAPEEGVPTVSGATPDVLPDLVALPAWGIMAESRRTHDYLTFGATVWVAGSSPLVVEGFRRPDSDVMDAYQYFYRDGEAVGRARAGTFRFDSRRGHQHWHFQDFARYSLLDDARARVVPSTKQAFCLAPTDAIDLGLAHAHLNPWDDELRTSCGSAGAIWIREALPVGWGDTYFQWLPGQSFDITNLPNGTYFIEVATNPGGGLLETTSANNVRLRRVIIGGEPGHRTVQVPPWRGIDTEFELGCSPFCEGAP